MEILVGVREPEEVAADGFFLKGREKVSRNQSEGKEDEKGEKAHCDQEVVQRRIVRLGRNFENEGKIFRFSLFQTLSKRKR